MSRRIYDNSIQTQRVRQLEVEALPPDRKIRLLLDLVHDGLGQPVSLPLLVARGAHPGPTFGITAALHGNEINGIPVIHQLFRDLDTSALRGSVAAVVVANVPGFQMNKRRFINDQDLNHIMPGCADGNVADVYVHRLVERIVKRFDFLLDLHTASLGRANALYVRADMTNPVAAQMAYLQNAHIIVHKRPSDRTLRGTAAELGIPAITLEIGNPQCFQPEYIHSALVGLKNVLSHLDMLPFERVASESKPVLCDRSYWLYTDHGGLLEVYPYVTQSIEEGQTVASLTDIFGDVIREYTADEPGIVIGKSLNPVGASGARILHLGILAGAKNSI